MRRGLPFSVRLDENVRKALEQAARADGRSLSSYVERVLAQHLVTAGFLSGDEFTPPAGRSPATRRRRKSKS